ncbi:hypothetical protein DKX38_005693 [Salix brachista]|uniref:Uncharacterized protein n=1 Tax=Salix brachista TaxID=2182728 RepID=A0A5N5N3E1_9ROSI|nr:hypothetical protein DKX38_005693 [Salix brachista]
MVATASDDRVGDSIGSAGEPVADPFGATRRGREFIVRKFVSSRILIGGIFGSFIDDCSIEDKAIWKLLMHFGRGLFWSGYVCVIVCGLLVFSVMLSGFVMRYLVEEPIQIWQDLNFDYAKNSPVAFVSIKPCGGVACDDEDYYNRNLGGFEVHFGSLSKEDAVSVWTSSLLVAPLVAGYESESQTLALKIKDFREGDVPTSWLEVIIEQRSEYRPGAGIPETYDVSIIPES